jgi:hypothetical protein
VGGERTISTSYTAAEIDAVCASAPELHCCDLIPVDDIADRRALHLRLDPLANNQAQGVKWARDYELREMVRKIRPEHENQGRTTG